MSLTFNSAEARKADAVSSVIRESGLYTGLITRAEKLTSKNKVQGLGLSFKSDDGASANYLDLYTIKPDGTSLRGFSIVQALLCCLRMRNVDDGEITFDKWDRESGRIVKARAPGYPALMGKRIGLVLQKELGINEMNGNETERMNILTVFEANSGLVSSEILDNKTEAKQIKSLERFIATNPVRDTRKKRANQSPVRNQPQETSPVDDNLDDDIPFAWATLIPLGGMLAYVGYALQTVLQV